MFLNILTLGFLVIQEEVVNQGNGELGKVEKLVQEFFQVNMRLIPPLTDKSLTPPYSLV